MKYHITLLLLFCAALAWSGIAPHDYFTWFLEVLPALIGVAVLLMIYYRYKLTNLTYTLILIHAVILMVGGHYTYAEVPLFDWIKEVFHQSRNNYDKVGHFAQGFIPAIIAREILIRDHIVNVKAWLNVFVVCICMAISAAYEFLEWGVAEMTGESSDAFLGTQGYAWDTQSDMLYATIGAITALIILSKYHNQSIEKIRIV
jgi:putative membrane protein